MPAHSVRDGAAGVAVLACVLVAGLSGCSSDDGEATSGVSGQPTQSGQATGAVAPNAAIRDTLAQLAADTSALKTASQLLIDKETVSEETRAIARAAEPVLTNEEAQLVKILGVDVESSEVSLDTATIDRLGSEEGPHADMAYLTLMEGGLDTLLERWEELKTSGGKELQDLVSSTHKELSDLREKLRQRLQY